MKMIISRTVWESRGVLKISLKKPSGLKSSHWNKSCVATKSNRKSSGVSKTSGCDQKSNYIIKQM